MVADIVLCRHSASVCSIPVVVCARSASAAARGLNLWRCSLSRSHGSAAARSSSASLINSSDRTSLPCLTGVRNHFLAAAWPAGVALTSERAGPWLVCFFPAICTRPRSSSRVIAA